MRSQARLSEGDGATTANPATWWPTARPSLRPLPLHPFASAPLSQVRASRQLRIPLETNRSSVPAHYASPARPLHTSPARRCFSHGDTRMARPARRYDRFQAMEDPDPPKPLLEPRHKARDHQRCLRFLALSPRAAAYYGTRAERRLKPRHPVRKLLALSDLYAPASVARALDAALTSEAFSAEDSANLWEQRARCTPEARALHLTQRGDRLALNLAPPDLSLYHVPPPPVHPEL